MEEKLVCKSLGAVMVEETVTDFTFSLRPEPSLLVRTKSRRCPLLELDRNGNESPVPVAECYHKALREDGALASNTNGHSYIAACGNSLLIIDNNQYKVEEISIGGAPRASLRGVEHLGGNMYAITDTSTGMVYVLDTETKQAVSAFGGKTPGPEHLLHPANVCSWSVRGKQTLIAVSDWAAHRLKLFNVRGEYVETIGGKGQTILYPAGVCADDTYGLFVCNSGRQNVLRMWYDGEGVLKREPCLTAAHLGKTFVPWQVRAKRFGGRLELAVSGTDSTILTFSITSASQTREQHEE